MASEVTQPIAVDLGRREIRALQVRAGEGGAQPIAAAQDRCGFLARDPILGEEDATAQGSALREALRAAGFAGARCALTLPIASFLTEMVELNTTTAAELHDAISFEAADRFSVERDSIECGALPLGGGTAANGPREHLVIALRRQTALAAVRFAAAAGLEPTRLECAALSAMRTVWRQTSPNGSTRVAALYMEDHRAALCVFGRSGMLFYRAFPWAMGSEVGASLDGPIAVAGDTTSANAWRWHALSEDLLQCLRRLERRTPGEWPASLYLCGPASGAEGLVQALSSVCGMPCAPAAPHSLLGAAVPHADATSPAWAAAIGATLAGVSRREAA